MIRIFIFLLVILSLAFGFSWIADHPGVVTLNWQGKDIRTSLMVVVVALVSLVAIILFVWGILRGVIGFPSILSRFLTNRRRDRGYTALSKGLIAAGTGDKVLARRLTKESSKLLTNEPLVELLEAQTCLLEGNHDAARGRFQSMLENEDTKLLGLRGLYLEAEREGAREATRQYAEQASKLAPSLAWAGNAKLQNQTLDGDWEGALGTLESNRAAGLIDKPTAIRHRAVLLTARAIAEEPANPDLAAKLAREAHRIAPDLVPAAVIGATALARGNHLRKASKMIETTWSKNPHRELAETYIHLRMGDSASDRLQRARTLAKLRTNHPEGNMAIAQAALDAKQWDVARDAMKPVLLNNLTERACLIMADLEEAEHGDAGRMRDWLSRAVRAPRDAKWTADGYTSEVWLPVSPTTGEIDVFEWKVPVEQLQETKAPIDIGGLAEPLKTIPARQSNDTPSQSPEKEGDKQMDEGLSDDTKQLDKTGKAAAIVGTAGVIAASATANEDVKQQLANESISSLEGEEEKEQSDLPDEEDNSDEGNADIEEGKIVELVAEVNDRPAKEENPEPMSDGDAKSNVDGDKNPKEPAQPVATIFPLKHRPDDPGVDEEQPVPKDRFKLF